MATSPRARARNGAGPPVLRHADHDQPDGGHEGEHSCVAPREIGVWWLVPRLLGLVGCHPGASPKDEVFCENDRDVRCNPVSDETLITNEEGKREGREGTKKKREW